MKVKLFFVGDDPYTREHEAVAAARGLASMRGITIEVTAGWAEVLRRRVVKRCPLRSHEEPAPSVQHK